MAVDAEGTHTDPMLAELVGISLATAPGKVSPGLIDPAYLRQQCELSLRRVHRTQEREREVDLVRRDGMALRESREHGPGIRRVALAVAAVPEGLPAVVRCTGASSKWGEVFDHGIDLIHPPFWWWAWEHGLAVYGRPLEPVAMITALGRPRRPTSDGSAST